MTPLELKERIEQLKFAWRKYNDEDITFEEAESDIKQLLYDVIQAVTPEKRGADDDDTDERFAIELGFSEAIDTIQENTKNLLGEKT